MTTAWRLLLIGQCGSTIHDRFLLVELKLYNLNKLWIHKTRKFDVWKVDDSDNIVPDFNCSVTNPVWVTSRGSQRWVVRHTPSVWCPWRTWEERACSQSLSQDCRLLDQASLWSLHSGEKVVWWLVCATLYPSSPNSPSSPVLRLQQCNIGIEEDSLIPSPHTIVPSSHTTVPGSQSPYHHYYNNNAQAHGVQ